MDREITCRSCGGPLHGRDGHFVLKYLLVERPRGSRPLMPPISGPFDHAQANALAVLLAPFRKV